MKHKFVLGILFAGVAMWGCETTVYFDVDTQENKLVVNAMVVPDSLNDATVSLSVDPIAIGFESAAVNDATIDMYRDDVLVGTYAIQGEGYYTIPSALLSGSSGHELRIEVSAPGREAVKATTQIPYAVPMYDLAITDTLYETISYSVIDEFGNVTYIDTIVPYFNIQFSFDDPVGDDHYMVDVDYKDAYSYVQACYTTDDPIFTVEDSYGIGGTNEDGSITFCDEVIFSDQTFEGKKKTLNVLVFAIATEFTLDPSFVVTLKHVSEDFYQYYTTSNQQYMGNDDPFSEPTIVFDNIEGGFGIFAGYTVSQQVLPLD